MVKFLSQGCKFEQNAVGPDAWAFDENSVIAFENNVISGGLQSIFIATCMGSKIDIKAKQNHQRNLD